MIGGLLNRSLLNLFHPCEDVFIDQKSIHKQIPKNMMTEYLLMMFFFQKNINYTVCKQLYGEAIKSKFLRTIKKIEHEIKKKKSTWVLCRVKHTHWMQSIEPFFFGCNFNSRSSPLCIYRRYTVYTIHMCTQAINYIARTVKPYNSLNKHFSCVVHAQYNGLFCSIICATL